MPYFSYPAACLQNNHRRKILWQRKNYQLFVPARQKIADDALTWGMYVSDDFSRQVSEADNLIQSDKKQRPDAPEWKDQKTDEALMKKYKKYTERRIEQRSDKNLVNYSRL